MTHAESRCWEIAQTLVDLGYTEKTVEEVWQVLLAREHGGEERGDRDSGLQYITEESDSESAQDG